MLHSCKLINAQETINSIPNSADNLTSFGSLRGLHLLKKEKGRRGSQEPGEWRSGGQA